MMPMFQNETFKTHVFGSGKAFKVRPRSRTVTRLDLGREPGDLILVMLAHVLLFTSENPCKLILRMHAKKKKEHYL